MLRVDSNYNLIIVILLTLVIAILCSEALMTDSREEEAYRNDAALTMLETGNWLVPYQFGERYLKKPPGINWLIAGASLPYGTVTDFSARTPILVLYLLLPITIYLITYRTMTVRCRVLASVASVLYLPWFVEKGPIMEIDLVFTFFVVLSMASWIHYEVKSEPYKKWGLSQLAACGAFFIKGPVIFVFYYPSILIYRIFLSDRKTNWNAFTTGLIVFLVPILTWFLSTLNQVSVKAWTQTVLSELSGPARRGATTPEIIEHLIKFPLESVFSYLPWILLLIPLLNKKIRKTWKDNFKRSEVIWFSISTLPIWFLFYALPASDVRYILPLYPWVGIITGSVVQTSTKYHQEFNYYPTIKMVLGVLLVLVSLALPLALPSYPFGSKWLLVGGILFLSLSGVIILMIKQSHKNINRIILYCTIFILSIKTVHLFVFHPTEHPEYFTRQTYTETIGQYLQENNINNYCYQPKSDHWKYFYLHKMKTGISTCKNDPFQHKKWVLSSNFSGENYESVHRFNHKNHHETTLYKRKVTE